MEITEERLARIIADTITQAISERRSEIATTPHVCFCADPTERRQHQDEHEALRRVIKFLDRIEGTKWKTGAVLIGIIASAALIALWEGVTVTLRR